MTHIKAELRAGPVSWSSRRTALTRPKTAFREFLGRLVTLAVAIAVLMLLAPLSYANAFDDAASQPHAGAVAMDSTMAGCADQHDGTTPQPPDDCRPGMVCHGGAPAIAPPAVPLAMVAPSAVCFVTGPEHLVVSRPADGILRPPRATASV